MEETNNPHLLRTSSTFLPALASSSNATLGPLEVDIPPPPAGNLAVVQPSLLQQARPSSVAVDRPGSPVASVTSSSERPSGGPSTSTSTTTIRVTLPRETFPSASPGPDRIRVSRLRPMCSGETVVYQIPVTHGMFPNAVSMLELFPEGNSPSLGFRVQALYRQGSLRSVRLVVPPGVPRVPPRARN